jgi:class 3 adenylate cyclase/tetratricopeptide (TPR) repeat protein
VTVLAGMLAQATALADRLGLEVFQALVQTFHSLVQDCVQRYEGSVQPWGEDGVLALFGVPVAQEEHAWRAVQAALALQQRLRQGLPAPVALPGAGLTARVGVHTGWVVARRRGSEPLQAVVGGDTTQGALCVQGLADPGTVVISDTTQRLLRGTVQSTAAGLVHLPGHATPLMAYTVQGLASPMATRAWSPLVGRQRELAVVDDLVARTLAGQGQVLGLLGEPGIGKSRFLAACRQRLLERSVTVLEGHCRSYEQGIPYGPIRDLLQHQCGLSATAPPDVVATRVEQLLRAVDLSPEDSAPYLLQLLGSPTATTRLAQGTPDVIKARTFATLRHVHLRSSQQHPLLLVVENLHWIDPTSEAYLASLVEHLAGHPLLLVATYRPGYMPLWMGKSYATQLTLPALTQAESRALVGAVWLPARQVAALVPRILARAQGNPLFLEELTRAVQEQEGLAPDRVPETIQAVLAARIDRLPLEEQHLLHTAAVLGTEVPVPLLAAMAGLPEAVLQERLEHLQEAELLYETRFLPEQVYTFKHALTHEVAYGSLLLEQRRGLHARLVAAIEALAPDPGVEQVERLAHHAMQGEVWTKAVIYCQQAGARARARAAFREAVVYFEQALQALAHLPEDGESRGLAIDLRFDLAASLYQLGEHGRCLTLRGEAEAMARGLNDRVRLGRMLAGRANDLKLTGDLEGAMAAGRQALELAVELGESALQSHASYVLAQVYYATGDFGQAVELLQRNVEAAEREPGAPSSERWLRSQAWLARTLSAIGAFAEGLRHGEAALRLATLEGRGPAPIIAHGCLGLLYLAQGDLEHAIRVFDQGLALCRASGDRSNWRSIAADLGLAYALQGRLTEGRALLEEGIREGIRTGALLHHSRWVAQLSEVCRLAGHHDEAWQHARQALDLARQFKERGNEALALHQLGVVHAHAAPPNVEEAEASYRQALALAEELGMRPLQAHCHCGLGTLYAKVGQREHARAALSTAIDLYRAMDMAFWLPTAQPALTQVEARCQGREQRGRVG